MEWIPACPVIYDYSREVFNARETWMFCLYQATFLLQRFSGRMNYKWVKSAPEMWLTHSSTCDMFLPYSLALAVIWIILLMLVFLWPLKGPTLHIPQIFIYLYALLLFSLPDLLTHTENVTICPQPSSLHLVLTSSPSNKLLTTQGPKLYPL